MEHPQRPYAPLDVFRSAVRYFPLVSVNIVAQRPDGSVLFLRRGNNPAKNLLWVPGGRILNGETIEASMLTVLRQETGLTGELIAASPEYLEELWPTDDFTEEDWKLYDRETKIVHYLATVGLVRVPQNAQVTVDSQSTDFVWSKTLPHDHPFQRRYFEVLERMGFKVL